jgi:hypothetical protein
MMLRHAKLQRMRAGLNLRKHLITQTATQPALLAHISTQGTCVEARHDPGRVMRLRAASPLGLREALWHLGH